MVTQASLARRVRKIETLVAGDGADGAFLIVRGSGMRGVKEAIERMRAIRDGKVPRPEGNGMRAYREAVLAEKARIAARAALEPSELEPPIKPLPKPKPLPPTPMPRPAATPRPARPPSRAPAPMAKAASKPAPRFEPNGEPYSVWNHL